MNWDILRSYMPISTVRLLLPFAKMPAVGPHMAASRYSRTNHLPLSSSFSSSPQPIRTQRSRVWVPISGFVLALVLQTLYGGEVEEKARFKSRADQEEECRIV
jgi:hypothetical protein